MKRLLSIVTLATFWLGLAPMIATAQTTNPDATFEFRPHCEDVTSTTCEEFEVRDPSNRQTESLKTGDILDMDLIIHNPSALPIVRYRAWVGYDSTTLEGLEIIPADAFPVATPGEMDFSVSDNYIKLSGSTDTPVNAQTIVVARLRMQVVKTSDIGTFLSFFDLTGTAESHTGVFTKTGEVETNVAAPVQGGLAVQLEGAAPASSAASSVASSVPAVPTSAASSVASVAPTSSVASIPTSAAPTPSSAATSSEPPLVTGVFSSLQVQALRVTTEGSSVFLAWNPLPSSELIGYNLYYGTISGRYLQKKSVDKTASTLTLRALPVGETYYFAVRGVNAGNQETDFSQEVAIQVGNPKTSTSPLSGVLIEGGPGGIAPGTGGNVAGDTGPASSVALFLGIAAIIGTVLALRRQFTAKISTHA